MINPKAMQSLFNPRKLETLDIQRFLEITGITKKKWYKIKVECECSKSIDESCINTECQYNLLHLHKEELYIEVLKEIQAQRREIEERTQRQMQKHYGTSFGGD